MKIVSWNVNGVRAVLKKGFLDFLAKYKPDILCLQEVKISEDAKTDAGLDFPGYREYWNCAVRPGYSGTAILVRDGVTLPLSLTNGLGKQAFDEEGRTQIAEFSDFYLVNCYFPNANHELSRLDYKLAFNDFLAKRLQPLAVKKPVVICGDFNVAHQEIDLARPRDNEGHAGFTVEERSWMDNFLRSGFIDTYRELHGEKVQYSWWSYRMAARQRNVGWRIDYFCVSAKMRRRLKQAAIMDQITGSDHCPILLEF